MEFNIHDVRLDDDRIRAQMFDKILGEPKIDIMDENALKTRRNLLAIASTVLFFKIFNLHLVPNFIFGMNVKGMNDVVLNYAFLIVILYMLAHFSLYALESFAEIKLRATGSFRTPACIEGDT